MYQKKISILKIKEWIKTNKKTKKAHPPESPSMGIIYNSLLGGVRCTRGGAFIFLKDYSEKKKET